MTGILIIMAGVLVFAVGAAIYFHIQEKREEQKKKHA